MKVDVKLVFLLVLGIIILTLINEIVYTKEYNREGFLAKLNPIDAINNAVNGLKESIMKPINAIESKVKSPINKLKSAIKNPIKKVINLVNYIVKGLSEVITFICFCKETFKWAGHTVKCTFALFWPLYCPLVRIIDMLIELIGFIISSIFRLFGLGFLVRVFNKGVDGIDSISELFFDIKLTSIWEKLFKNCYRCKFKPFPIAKKR
jgi:predicted PurR-regulated permease PerM